MTTTTGRRTVPSTLGCAPYTLRGKLRDANLRLTHQRMALGWLIFGKGRRHITAEALYEEAIKSKITVSLATVYNTLRQFTEAGILREIATDRTHTFFDTNTSPHHHFLILGTNVLIDMPDGYVAIADSLVAPAGTEIAGVDVIVRLRSASRNRD